LKLHIKGEFEASRKTYGSPRLKLELNSKGVEAGKHRIARLMKEEGLAAIRPKKFRVTTNSKHKLPRTPNLVQREFEKHGHAPNKLWVTDITYVWTQQGWLYLCVFLDVFSRKVVGYSLEDNMEASMVNAGLQMALGRRQIGQGLMIHSDQGIQYASRQFRNLVEAKNIVQSMSRKGDCWDNSIAESFFATIKKELIHRQSWERRSEAKSAISEWIESFYNRKRRHSSIGGLSPVEFERLTTQSIAA
jgi:putative transposase